MRTRRRVWRRNHHGDELVSVKNSMHFMNQEIKKKLTLFREIREKYAVFEIFKEENEKFIATLQQEIASYKRQAESLKGKYQVHLPPLRNWRKSTQVA